MEEEMQEVWNFLILLEELDQSLSFDLDDIQNKLREDCEQR